MRIINVKSMQEAMSLVFKAAKAGRQAKTKKTKHGWEVKIYAKNQK